MREEERAKEKENDLERGREREIERERLARDRESFMKTDRCLQ